MWRHSRHCEFEPPPRSVSPLRAHWFEDRREQVSVHRRDLSDVECGTGAAAAAAAATFLHTLPQASAACTVAQGTGQVATAPRCHGYGGLRSRRCSGL